MKSPAMHLVQGLAAGSRVVDCQEKSIPPSRRRIASAEARWNQGSRIAHTGWRDDEGNRLGGPAGVCTGDHRRAIERENAHTVEGVRVSKEVRGKNIGSARLRIIPHR